MIYRKTDNVECQPRFKEIHSSLAWYNFNKMKVIVGLGNPGTKYENTRHNLGFRVADSLLRKCESSEDTFWEEDKKGKLLYKKCTYKNEPLLLLKPQTFMNNSGIGVSYFINMYKIPIEDLIVVYDELDLPLGKIRVRFGGAAGGHRGVMSIIEQLGDDKFLRVRLGIGHPRRSEGKLNNHSNLSAEDYVVAPFTRGEENDARELVHKAEKSVLLILEHGIDQYMSKYHSE